jgi:cellulose synthase/poly-beta-1,6-N-acetylglucosamine synthase-like glycosyltransferase
MTLVLYIYFIFLLLMILQSSVMLYLNLYVWLDEDRLLDSEAPKKFLPPKNSFTIMLPAYHEEAVLGETVKRVAKMKYPKKLYEILIILQPKDRATIRIAKEALRKNRVKNARVLIVDPSHTPLNKPYQLNVALKHTQHDHVVIFDSEDEVHPKILSIADTMYQQKDVDIIQAGVQLVNYADRWFSSANVLEYFFWFKSRMHAHMKMQVAPLGGNTVFFKTHQLREVGGWNEHCLTEDAEIGIRLCEKGSKMCATYDAEFVTREETPLTVGQFIKQRTRWCQGFLQIIQAGTIKRLPSRKQRIVAYYLLGFPMAQAVVTLMSPLVLFYGMSGDMPFLVSMLSFVPVLLVITLLGTQIIGLYEFVREQQMAFKLRGFVWLIVGFIPYQILLSIGALRAWKRQLTKSNDWEKTIHVGAHRSQPVVEKATS